MHVSPMLRDHVLANIVEPVFKEFHLLLQVADPQQGPKGSMQRSLAVLILSAIDGAAQLFQPGKDLGTGQRFTRYVETNFPWSLDFPTGFTIPEAAEVLYKDARCPIIHRFGASSGGNWLKYGKAFTITAEEVEAIERRIDLRPYSKPSISRDDTRIVVWLESLYWAVRLSIIKALDTPEKCEAIEEWLKSGNWDQTANRDVAMPEVSDATATVSVAVPTKLHGDNAG
ncbi:MAG TPA: hypothetical protein VH933_02415 [Aestuariivirgaceae bacterium]